VASSKPGVFEARFPGLNISLKDGAGGEVIDWSLDTDFLTATDAWSITLVDDRPLPRWYELQQVEIYIEGKRHLIGRCDRTERGAEGSIIKIEGRDYLADMTECNIDPSLTFRAGISLEVHSQSGTHREDSVERSSASEEVPDRSEARSKRVYLLMGHQGIRSLRLHHATGNRA
jgi:hypothetical protein